MNIINSEKFEKARIRKIEQELINTTLSNIDLSEIPFDVSNTYHDEILAAFLPQLSMPTLNTFTSPIDKAQNLISLIREYNETDFYILRTFKKRNIKDTDESDFTTILYLDIPFKSLPEDVIKGYQESSLPFRITEEGISFDYSQYPKSVKIIGKKNTFALTLSDTFYYSDTMAEELSRHLLSYNELVLEYQKLN